SRSISPRTTSVGGLGRELRHLLADSSHQRSILAVGCKAAYLGRNGGASATFRRSLPQCSTHRLRVVQSVASNDTQRCRRAVVQAHVKGTSHQQNVAQCVLHPGGRGV